MKEAIKNSEGADFGSKEYVKNFYQGLSEDQKEQFKLIEAQIRDDFGDISRLQRAIMTISYMVQMKALAAGYEALGDEDDLPKWKRDILDFARKLYKSEVGRLAQNQKVEEERRSMAAILKDWLSDNDKRDIEEIEPPDFEKVDPESLDIDNHRGGGADEGDGGGEIFDDTPENPGNTGDDDDSGNSGGSKRHSAGSFINVG